MKNADIQAIGAAVGAILKDFRQDIVKEFSERMVWRGTYRKGEQYLRGNFVTHQGSLWHSETDAPTGAPGDGTLDWKLCVKRGEAEA